MSSAVVMGASSPIGAATTIRLAKDGHDVVIQYLRHENEAASLAESVEKLGQKTLLVRHRLDREGDTQDFCKIVLQNVEEVDTLVVAAAAGVMRPIEALSEHHLNWTLRTTSIPLVIAASTFRPRSVVAISSLGATRVVNNYASVGIAKAALEAAVRYLSVELAPESRVNGISAGLVRTGGARLLPDFEKLVEQTLRETPMGRLVTETDIAELVSFLASPRSAMLTGTIIPLDGGHGLRW